MEVENHKSVSCGDAKRKVEKEIVQNIANGVYEKVEDKPKIVSALGAVPKKNGGIRLIHDASLPEGRALNDYASKEPCRYQTVTEAVSHVRRGWYMAKVDLQSAYKSVSIAKLETDLTGLKWHFEGEETPQYLRDRRLPFGARKSPAIFNRITQAVRRMMIRRGFHACVCLLDDFWVAGETFQQCLKALNTLICLLRSLGFAINWAKVADPAQDLVFLGIRINTVSGTLSLDPDKTAEVIRQLNWALGCTRMSRSRLESITGKLSWAANVVVWGRSRLCYSYTTIAALKKPKHKLRIQELKNDWIWWRDALAFGSRSRRIWDQRPSTWLSCDACSVGGGAFYHGDWVYCNWQLDSDLASVHINIKELAIIQRAIQRWAASLAKSRVYILTDSAVAAAYINNQHSSNPEAIKLLQSLANACHQNDIQVVCIHVPGANNALADAVSRLHEGGQIHRFVALLWAYFGGCSATPCAYQLRKHMSLKSCILLSPQVAKWTATYENWIRKLLDGGPLHLHHPRSRLTDRSEECI